VRFERLLLIVAAIALAWYGRWLYRNLSYAAGGPDSGGYMNQAQLIASGHVTEPVPLVRELGLDDSWLGYFMPLGFAPSPHASMHPLYPPGLPMHLAAAGSIGGWKRAPFLVAPLAALGCVILVIAVARLLGVPLLLSFAGAFAVAALPPFLWHAEQPASDVVAMFWALVAMYFALLVERRPSLAAVAAGIAFAVGVWVRPTNALMVIPLAMAVRFRWRDLVRIAIGAAPLVIALMVWNAKLYGSPFRTGYGDIQLTWQGAMTAGPQHAEWLFKMLTAVVFPCGLLVVFDRRIGAWTRWMLFAWFVAYYVFYSFYGFFDGPFCLRFLLPAIPAAIFGALLLMRDAIAMTRGGLRIGSVAVATALCVWMGAAPVVYGFRLNVIPTLQTTELGYPQWIAFADRHLPKRAVVMTGVLSGAFLYYDGRSIVRYDQLTGDRFQLLRAYAGNRDLPWYAVLSAGELDLAGLRRKFPGDWQIVDQFGDFTIYRLAN